MPEVRCLLCLAIVPEGVCKCPKCGGTVFSGGNTEPLRSVVKFFSTPVPFFVKASKPIIVDGALADFKIEWKLYLARLQQNAPVLFIWDRDGYVAGKPEAALHLIGDEDLASIMQELPESKQCELKKILRNEWGVKLEEDENLFNVLQDKPLFFEPVPRLKDPAILLQVDWKGYVDRLVCPKPGKDPKLIAVHRAKLVKPLAMQYAPHSLEIANSNTGKTRFYEAAGIKIDKATRKAVLGFAKSPLEVYPGTINGTELPTAFDQIESQDSYELAKYMLDLLECGQAFVDSGGIRFQVGTKSCFAYIGNPVAKDAKVVEGFKALLNHVCSNPAMGRRFGIILFATNLETIRGSDRMSVEELEEWKRSFTLLRAVEEYAEPKLRQLLRNPKVVEWLHQPIKGYRETLYSAVQEVDDHGIAAFFEAHAEAEHRVRGAALHAAIALLLDKIALDKISVDELLEEADELLSEYVNINLQSTADLCSMWDKLRTEQAKTFFENLSDYMQEIVGACILYKREKPETTTITLDQIPYQPKNYDYFSKCIDRLKRRKTLQALNETLRNFYGFQLVQTDGSFTVEYFENPQPPEDLKPLGFLNFSNFSISQSSQTGILSEVQESKGKETVDLLNAEKFQEQVNEKNSASENIEKLRNLRNGEKTRVCGSCVFWRTGSCPAERPDLLVPSCLMAETCPRYQEAK